MEQIRKTNKMAIASLVFAVLAIFSIFDVYRVIFFGSMGILFAVLSRGSGLKMPDRAVGGFVTSVIAMVISVVLTAFSMYLMIRIFGFETATNPEALEKAVMELYKNLLGGSGL